MRVVLAFCSGLSIVFWILHYLFFGLFVQAEHGGIYAVHLTLYTRNGIDKWYREDLTSDFCVDEAW